MRGVIADGHEIGIHSWIHEANATLPPSAERDLTLRAADTREQIAKTRPVGIRTASWDFSVETLSIIQELGLLYDSNLMTDDDPYELESGGQPTGIVELPPNGSATTPSISTSSASAPCAPTRPLRRARNPQG